ncbi:MAG: HAD family hydrolase, partial [Rhodospirillales bacterium]
MPTDGGRPAVIFDVDGVLVDSPHERAWQEALAELMGGDWREIAPQTSYTPDRFTSEVYQTRLSGKPRMSGARSVLDYFGVPDLDRRVIKYAENKQKRIEALIDAGEFVAYADAIRFVTALKANGVRIAAASSSKN